jgi:arginine/lysine/ornithine decarboxylase
VQTSWLAPQLTKPFGAPLPISPEQVKEAIKNEPDIGVIYLTSPTYDGLYADIKGIKKVIGDRVLVIDEAHGAAGYF